MVWNVSAMLVLGWISMFRTILLSPFQFCLRGPRVAHCDGILHLSWITKLVTLRNEVGENVANRISWSTNAKLVIDKDGTILGDDQIVIQIVGVIVRGWGSFSLDVVDAFMAHYTSFSERCQSSWSWADTFVQHYCKCIQSSCSCWSPVIRPLARGESLTFLLKKKPFSLRRWL